MSAIDWVTTIYNIITDLLFIIGIWKIFKKCGGKGWHALIPGYRYYRLGIIGGRETDGIMALFMDLFDITVRIFANNISEESAMYDPVIMISLALSIAAFVYKIRVISGVVRTFRAGRKWLIIWILLPWLGALVFGFSENFRPVDLGIYDEDELLAGTAAAEIAAPVDDDPSDDGLVIHLRSRTVRSHGRKRLLLKDINLTIPDGSLVLLLGGSGAGKTTLINALIGYEKADAKITLSGIDIYKHYKEMKHRIGYVPQQDLLRQNDTVLSTLQDAARFRLPKNISAAEREARVNDVIETLGLSGRAQGLVAKKSGGQKKRISIGMELISDPQLFILDEPDSGLDGVIARELFERLRQIADQGKIVIAITHTPDRVVDLFDKVIVLARDSGKVGRLAFYGSPDEAREFFERDTMERIVMTVNNESEGGEGRADEIIAKFAELTAEGRQVNHDKSA